MLFQTTCRLARLAAIALAVSACATQNMSPADANSISRIVLAGPENPARYNLVQGSFSDSGLAGAAGIGSIAGTLAGSMNDQGNAAGFTATMQAQNLALGDELARAVSDGLAANGYTVATAKPQRRKTTELLDSYAGIGSGADAILDIAIEHSTYERRVWGKIGPSLTINARLVDARTSRRFLQRTYRYDFSSATLGYTLLRPPPEFGFDTMGEVMANPERAAAGFRAVIPMIVADLTAQLPKK
ncbi:MAG: hypothetical protein VW600_14890 [Ferrovibrio sp.]